ncbi:MAG: hypothetical protein JNN04_16215 [Cyclobacteriaceae bacterium]|nr:hypothetical protein [Cyclobacteriaceae bacterium]
MKKALVILVILASLSVTRTIGQEFVLTKTELTGTSIILYFDLVDTVKARTYTINLYSSKDDFVAPLQKVSGDVGLEVKPGQTRKIVWNSKDELGASFHGDIELEVRGRVYVPFVRFDGFQEEQVIRRGKPKTMTWSGGTRQNILNFSIYNKDGEFVDVIPNVANSGSYEMVIPMTVKPGKGYYFMVSDSKNKDQVMKTPPFEVKRKVPLGVKLIPVVAVGAAAAFLLPKSSNEKSNISGPPDVPSTTN